MILTFILVAIAIITIIAVAVDYYRRRPSRSLEKSYSDNWPEKGPPLAAIRATEATMSKVKTDVEYRKTKEKWCYAITEDDLDQVRKIFGANEKAPARVQVVDRGPVGKVRKVAVWTGEAPPTTEPEF